MRFLIVLAATLALAGPVTGACKPGIVSLRGDFGQADIRVELAETLESQSNGLKFRESMPRFSGMLFVFPTPKSAVFWMQDTPLPLDMIFADESGLISRIHKMAIPFSLDHIDGGSGVLAVLEVNGGLTDKLGLKPGDQMRHPAFQRNQVWSCE